MVLVLCICICDEFIQLYSCQNTSITSKDFKILIALAKKKKKILERKEIFVPSSLGKAGPELREESLGLRVGAELRVGPVGECM